MLAALPFSMLLNNMYNERTNCTTDVLSMLRKTSDGYEVEHLLSKGTLSYKDIPQPVTKEFYRKGWSKYDIGLDADYNDITKEEYDTLYKQYTA